MFLDKYEVSLKITISIDIFICFCMEQIENWRLHNNYNYVYISKTFDKCSELCTYLTYFFCKICVSTNENEDGFAPDFVIPFETRETLGEKHSKKNNEYNQQYVNNVRQWTEI